MNKPTRYIIGLLIIIGMLVFGAEVFGQVILKMHEGDMIAFGDYRLGSSVSTVTKQFSSHPIKPVILTYKNQVNGMSVYTAVLRYKGMVVQWSMHFLNGRLNKIIVPMIDLISSDKIIRETYDLLLNYRIKTMGKPSFMLPDETTASWSFPKTEYMLWINTNFISGKLHMSEAIYVK